MKALIITGIICPATFAVLYFLSRNVAQKKSDKIIDTLYNGGSESLFLKKQFLGIIALSVPVIFYFILNLSAQKLLSLTLSGSWFYSWIIAMLLCLFISSRATANQLKKLKKQNSGVTKPANITALFTGRIIFLFLYELFFRGVLLFSIAAIAGNIPSIFINTLLYAVLHAHCSRNEIIATIPFGIVTCLLSIAANSIWPAILLHIIIAITTEGMLIFSIKKPCKLIIT